MLIDTHCHLDAAEFAADRDDIFARAQAAGVGAQVVPAVAAATFVDVQACCRRYGGCFPAYGIHPMYTPRAGNEDCAILRRWLTAELGGPQAPVAVGEIGLDLYVPQLQQGEGLARQEAFFVEQLKIARDFDLPVILHIRRAVDPILKQLRRFRPRGGIAHAFNGSRQQAEAFIALGFKLGFGGSMTFSGSTRIRELATTLPLEALVLETDAPDIPPAFLTPGSDRRNKPEYLPRFALALAELRGIPLAAVTTATSANALAALPGLAATFRAAP
ncbi:TatD related DNase [Azospira sp. I13]|uniref:TatD family hydrolase n=1 Tax=Azospira sp. I13 TaxID=1765050 RepID=UPI000D3F6737|nr:TatD family hydrolase [Azospira sp. I13]GBG02247.1 TatD related DNase [Azospira sp. I13]